MGNANHGKRNLTTWQRTSRRQREALRRTNDIQVLLRHIDTIEKAQDEQAEVVNALIELVIRTGHSHPARDGGLVLVGQRYASLPEAVTKELFADLCAKWREIIAQRKAAAAAVAPPDAPAVEGEAVADLI